MRLWPLPAPGMRRGFRNAEVVARPCGSAQQDARGKSRGDKPQHDEHHDRNQTRWGSPCFRYWRPERILSFWSNRHGDNLTARDLSYKPESSALPRITASMRTAPKRALAESASGGKRSKAVGPKACLRRARAVSRNGTVACSMAARSPSTHNAGGSSCPPDLVGEQELSRLDLKPRNPLLDERRRSPHLRDEH